MTIKEREQVIKDLQEIVDNYSGSWQRFNVFDGALTLIKELTEEIKDLEEDYDRVYEQAEADIHGNMADGGTSCHWCMNKTKADTVKRMQERLKARCSCIPQHHFTYAEVAFWIDQITKELLEEKNNV